MSFPATVLRVLIASPSDVLEVRESALGAMRSWNEANSVNRRVVLLPWRWETAAVPALGGRAQSFINAQGVDDADIVFAFFGGRLGSPSGEAVSGTAEEIDRAVAAGKPVHLYFSTAALPHDIDTEQLDALRAFRDQIAARGLLGEFSTPDQLNFEVWRAIEYDLAQLQLPNAAPPASEVGAVDWLVQPHQEREVSGVSSNGAPRYSTNHWLDVTNRGSRDAEEVTFSSAGAEGSMLLSGQEKPTVVHRGQTRRIPIHFAFSSDGEPILRISWSEEGVQQQRDFHVG